MAARATWKGVLKISLVTIPIKVFPATENSETLSFNQLHAECQTRIQQRKWCPACGREITNVEIVKGFEFEKGRYVLLNEAELDAVKPASTRVIDLVQFADESALDPMYLDRSYYLGADGELAGAAYAVLNAALRGQVGIGKLALYGREYLVAVRTWHKLLMLHTLHHDAELRRIDDLDIDAMTRPVPSAEVTLARQVLGALTSSGPLNLAAFTDAYQVDLRRLIDAKIAGEEIVAVALVDDVPAVVNLRDALTASLQAMESTVKPSKGASVRAPVEKKRMAKAPSFRPRKRAVP